MNQVPGAAAGLRKYIPASLGNRERETPIVVTLKQPSRGRLRMFAAERLGERLSAAETLRMQSMLLAEFVERVDNYVDASGAPIRTGEELWEHGEDEIVFEVCESFLSGGSLTDAEKKLLSAQSSSASQETER